MSHDREGVVLFIEPTPKITAPSRSRLSRIRRAQASGLPLILTEIIEKK